MFGDVDRGLLMVGSNASISVVLPCLDERDAVAECVKEAIAGIAATGLSGEVIVVDNGSTDGSPELAAGAGARVIHEPRRGYGRALRTGFEAAEGSVVVMADADGTYDFTKIPEVTGPVLADTADLVLATRLDGATTETMPFLHRYVGTPVITFLTSRASGRRLTADSQTGYRAFDRNRMEGLGLRSDGMELASEMLIKAARAGLRIENVPGGYRPRIGESKLDTWSDGWRHLMLILVLAPDLALIGPGLALSVFGVAALVLAFLQPAGVTLGSARWQPVFFSGIALVLGLQALFAGLVVESNSAVTPPGRRHQIFLLKATWPVRALGVGVSMMVAGLLIDFGMFVAWLRGVGLARTTGLAFGFAALAQSLLLVGGSLALFAVCMRFMRPARERNEGE